VNCHAHTRGVGTAAGALAALATVTATAGLLAPAGAASGHPPEPGAEPERASGRGRR
jgi:hypothetical protein